MKQNAKKLPSLSVVVPVYNEENQLQPCLKRLVAQPDVAEILIVDNNSTDNSVAIAKKFIAEYPKVVHLSYETRQGLVPARNRGFKEAKGEIVARIDADTQVQPDWAASIRSFFAEHSGIDALYGETRYHDLPFEKTVTKVSSFVVEVCNRLSSGSASLYGPNMALRTNIARKVTKTTCSVSHIMEDLDLTLHLREKGGKISYCPGMVVYISGRRLTSFPFNYWRYCIMWPRTYWLHGVYAAAMVTGVVAFVGCILQTIVFIPLRAYDPKRKQFSLQKMRRQEDRIIP